MHAPWSRPKSIAGQGLNRKSQRGMALVFALLGILLLSMLAAALMFVTSAGAFASLNYKSQTQANYVATAGVQRAMDWYLRPYYNWLTSSAGIGATAAYTGRPPTLNGNPVTLADPVNAVNFPDSSIKDSFNAMGAGSMPIGNTTARYTLTKAELVSHDRYMAIDGTTVRPVERWRISVTGEIQGVTSTPGITTGMLGNTVVQETAMVETKFISIFSDAIRGMCEVNIGGNLTTDSYYSTPVPSPIYTGPDAGASVGSNSFVRTAGSSGTINGDLYYGQTSGSCVGTANLNNPGIVQGDILQAPGPSFPPIDPTFTTGGVSPNDCRNNGPLQVAKGPNKYAFTPNTKNGNQYHECTLQASEVAQLRVPNSETPQTFFLYGLDSRSAGAETRITHADGTDCLPTDLPGARCAPVKLYVLADLHLGGAGIIAAQPCQPTRLAIYYAGTADADYTGSGAFCGTIYAPNATVNLAGGTTIYGAVSGLNVRSQGDVTVHYDLALQSLYGTSTPYRIVNQSRNVF